MIGIIDVQVQAASPNIPLAPVRSFTGAPSSIRVRNVPRAVGKWSVTAVSLTYTLPNNTTGSSPCVLTGGIWVGSVPACATAGTVTRGLTVVASGTDQTGAAVTGYILGVANIEILAVDASVAPGVTKYALRFCQTAPATPAIGDVAYFNDVLKFYDGTQWKSLGGGGSVTLDDTVTESSSNGVKSSGIWSFVKGLLPTWLTPSYAEPATVASVAAETSRATGVEATKADASALTAEVTRATAAEATKEAKFDAGSGLQFANQTVHKFTAVEWHEPMMPTVDVWSLELPTEGNEKPLFTDEACTTPYIDTTYGQHQTVKVNPEQGGTPYLINGGACTYEGAYSIRVLAVVGKQSAISANGILKGNGSGAVTAATAGTDYATPAQVNAKVGSFATVGTQTPTVANGVADLSPLFTSENTSLNSAIAARINTMCSGLDPGRSTISDIINALKGN